MVCDTVIALESDNYQPHWLHHPSAQWFETNCYTDLWIELLHALDLEPLACLGCTLVGDFEVDQWTFFKPSLSDLEQLYGLTTQELTIWRDVAQHCEDHARAGNIPLIEVDAFYLPDTAQTDYRRAHTKTTIAVNGLDQARRQLTYFHNGGYFALEGEDFDGLFGVRSAASEQNLAPYCEYVKLHHKVSRTPDELRSLALSLARRALQMRPASNPITEFGNRVDGLLAQLVDLPEAAFHRWVFATLRQLGAASELAAAHLDWLNAQGDISLQLAADKHRSISATAKKLIMKCARIAASGKLTSVQDYFVQMADDLDAAYTALEEGLRA